MAVSGTPAGSGHLIGEIRVDGTDFVSVDHPHVQTASSGTVGKACQDFYVLRCFPKTEITVLVVFAVHFQFFGQCRP